MVAENAEDAARVLTTSYEFGSDLVLDAQVPKALARASLRGDCVVTSEFTPIEPDGVRAEVLRAGIGLFLEVIPNRGRSCSSSAATSISSAARLPARGPARAHEH